MYKYTTYGFYQIVAFLGEKSLKIAKRSQKFVFFVFILKKPGINPSKIHINVKTNRVKTDNDE